MQGCEEKLKHARNSFSTIIHLIDSSASGTRPEVLLDMIRSEAVDCLDRIRES